MENKGVEKQATKLFEGVDIDTGERIQKNIDKIQFLADCFASGKMDLTAEGRTGCYWMLHDIAKDLEQIIDGPA